jgi:transposase
MELRLPARDREALESVVRRQRSEARSWRRARMLLLADNGESVAQIARMMGTSRPIVRTWIQRYRQDGLAGLGDRPRSGRPEIITPLERHQVVATACLPPKRFGLCRSIWSHDTLAETLERKKLVQSISASTVGRILEEAEIKPHRVKMWCHSNDPRYQEKMREIVKLYVAPPKGAALLSIDEKTGMQALSRVRALKAVEPGKDARQDFEYRRNGTRCLFGCFNVKTGKVIGRCTETRKREDFFSFLDLVARRHPRGRVHVVLDNLNTHVDTRKRAYMTQWNRRHGNRFLFHYTPTHGSWLNQIELWFGIVTRRILRYGQFESPDALVAAIEAFIAEWNAKEAHPFRWTYDGLPLVSGERP